MNPLRAATISVADLDAAIGRYGTCFDYRPVEQGSLDAAVAESFQAPALAGARTAVLRPASGRSVDLRLIEAPAVAGFQALRTHGWAAIEICIEDVARAHRQLQGGPFEIIGPPSAIAGLPTIHPMQVEGSDGEVVFLTQILRGGPGSGLPTATTPFDTVFICVLACRDMPATARWFAAKLDAALSGEIVIPYRTVSRAFGLPSDHLHTIATAEKDGHIFLEFDQYPEQDTARPRPSGRLPPGIGVVSVSHPDLDLIPGPWLTPPATRTGAIYGGARAGMLASPEGALLEVIEGRG